MNEPVIVARRRWPRALIAIGSLFGLGFLFVLLLPTIASRTGLRNILLAQALPSQISASCGDASIGWFTPLHAEDITVIDGDNRWEIHAATASSEKTLLQILTNTKQLGEFVIDQPVISINVDAWAAAAQKADEPERPKLGTKRDVAIVVRVIDATIQTTSYESEEPNVVAKQMSVAARFERVGDSETLAIDPGTPLREANLSPEMCHTLLKYVTPVVSDAAWTEGSLSVRLEECTIPFNRPEDSVVSGELTIHSVRVGVREGVGQQITQLVATLTQKEIPTTVQLLDNSQVQFTVANGLVTHQGFAFGLPEVSNELVIKTHGTVAFDKQIDLEAEIPLPFHLLGDGPIAQALGNETLYLPITGTLDEPNIRFDGAGQPVGDIITKLANPLLSGETSVGDLLTGLLDWRQNRKAKRGNAGSDNTFPDDETLNGGLNGENSGNSDTDDADSNDLDRGDKSDDSSPGFLERFRNRRRRRLSSEGDG